MSRPLMTCFIRKSRGLSRLFRARALCLNAYVVEGCSSRKGFVAKACRPGLSRRFVEDAACRNQNGFVTNRMSRKDSQLNTPHPPDPSVMMVLGCTGYIRGIQGVPLFRAHTKGPCNYPKNVAVQLCHSVPLQIGIVPLTLAVLSWIII